MGIKALARKYNGISLIKRIVAGLAVGTVPGIAFPSAGAVGLLGTLFVSALKAAHTLGVAVNPLAAVVLSALATASACGASGAAGGSLLLIPLACSLFGSDGDVSLQVVAIGFIIGVVQDSCETALDSSSNVLFTAAAEYRRRRLGGRSFRLGCDAFDENELA